jgi:hypothetical protein
MLAFAMMAAIRHRSNPPPPKKTKRRTPAKTKAQLRRHWSVGQYRKFAASPTDPRETVSNPHISSHGHSCAELAKLPLSERTSKQNGNCNANMLASCRGASVASA